MRMRWRVAAPSRPAARYRADLCGRLEPALEETGSERGVPHVAACHRKREIELEGL